MTKRARQTYVKQHIKEKQETGEKAGKHIRKGRSDT